MKTRADNRMENDGWMIERYDLNKMSWVLYEVDDLSFHVERKNIAVHFLEAGESEDNRVQKACELLDLLVGERDGCCSLFSCKMSLNLEGG